MIDKLKRIYPKYTLLVRKENKLYNESNEEFKELKKLLDSSYIIIEDEFYEVHKRGKEKLK